MTKLQTIESKVVGAEQLQRMLNTWRLKSQKIVFTNGCFDLLHLGHIDYLSKAADLGDRLVIGLNSDLSISGLKGNNRPITSEISRARLLASLFFVDAVILFNDLTPLNLITSVKPDVLVKGADYTIDKIVGADVVLANSGEVKTIEYIDGYSTTAIELKIKNGQ